MSLRLFGNSLLKCGHFRPISLFSPKFVYDTVVIDPPEEPVYRIPRPVRENETIDVKKARLLYQSRKRGMLENDLLLSTFIDKYLDSFTEQQLDEYDKLINGPSNDWEIYHWATEHKPVPHEFNNSIMNLLKEHTKNIQNETRTRMPDLK